MSKKLQLEIAGKGWQDVSRDVSKLVKSLHDLKKEGVDVSKILSGIESGKAFDKFNKSIEASKKNIEALNTAISSGQNILKDQNIEAEKRVIIEKRLVDLTERRNALSQQRVTNTVSGIAGGLAAGAGIAGLVYGGASSVAGAFNNRIQQQELGKNAAMNPYNNRMVEALQGNAYREIFLRNRGKDQFATDYMNKTGRLRMAEEGYLFNSAFGGKVGRTGAHIGEAATTGMGGLLAGGAIGAATAAGWTGTIGAALTAAGGGLGIVGAGLTGMAALGALPAAGIGLAGYLGYKGIKGMLSDPHARRQQVMAEQRKMAENIFDEGEAVPLYALENAIQKAPMMSEMQRILGTKVFGTGSMGVNGALGMGMSAGFSEGTLATTLQQVAAAGGSSGMQNRSFLRDVTGLGRDTGVDAMGSLYGTVTSKTGASGEQAYTLMRKAFSDSIGKVPFKIEKEAYAQAVGEATRRIGSQNNLGAEGFGSIASQILRMLNPNSGVSMTEQLSRASRAIDIQSQAGSTGVGYGVGLSNASRVLRGSTSGGASKTGDMFRLQELMSTPGTITADNPELEDIYQRQFGGTKTTKAQFMENLKGAQQGMIEKSLSFMVSPAQFKKMSISQKANLARQFGGFKNRSQADMESYIQGVYGEDITGPQINFGSIPGQTLAQTKEAADAQAARDSNILSEKHEPGIKEAIKAGGKASGNFMEQTKGGTDFSGIADSLESNLGRIAKALNGLNAAAAAASSRMSPSHIK